MEESTYNRLPVKSISQLAIQKECTLDRSISLLELQTLCGLANSDQLWMNYHSSCIFMDRLQNSWLSHPTHVCASVCVCVCSGRPFNTTKAQKRSRSPRGRRPQYRMQMSSRDRMTISRFAYVRVFFNAVRTSLGRSRTNNMRRLSLGKWGGFFISGQSGFSNAGKRHPSPWDPTSTTTTRIRVSAKQIWLFQILRPSLETWQGNTISGNDCRWGGGGADGWVIQCWLQPLVTPTTDLEFNRSIIKNSCEPM